ncbi:MAG: SBBP repeat-containing protein [Thermodesulfovibrionales bacterium]
MRKRIIHKTLLVLLVLIMAGYAWPGTHAHSSPGPSLENSDTRVVSSIGPGASLLQFTSGGHVLGFDARKVYIGSSDHMLTVEFLGLSGKPGKPSSTRTSMQNSKAASLKKVLYTEIWEGISLTYESVPEGIAESTYHVSPGADVSQIRLRYNLAPEIEKSGSLKFTFRNGHLTESAPIAWQEIGGIRVPVEVAFNVSGNEVGFRVGEYDRRYQLTIDPTYVWHTFYGSGDGINTGSAIALDNAGNIYITGQSEASWDGPAGFPDDRALHDFSSTSNLFVLKLDSSGTYQWHTFWGAGNTFAFGIAVDSSGNVYVTGNSTASWNGQGNASPRHGYSGNVSNIVVLKLATNGAYQWHTFYGANRFHGGYGIALDGIGNVYITGESNATWNGASGQSPANAFTGNGANIFALKLNAVNGNYLTHTFYGGTGNAAGYSIAVDGSNTYVTGSSDATWDGPSSQLPLNAFSDSLSDIVILKLNNSLVYQWHTFYGGSAFGFGISLDGLGNLYITGESDASWNGPIGEGPLNPYAGGISGTANTVILKLTSNGAYQWHTFYGTSEYGSFGNSIFVAGGTNVYITGPTNATWNGPSGQLPVESYTGLVGTSNTFALKLDSAGLYQWHTFNGENSHGEGIAATSAGDIYVTGESIASWNGPSGQLPLHPYDGTVSDIFVMKMFFTTLPTVSTAAVSDIKAVSATSGGNVVSDGNAAVTARGVCWSFLPNPTTADSCINSGTGTGPFTSLLTGLTINTGYHVRAYAINAAGTAYGDDLQFTTLSQYTLTVTLAGTGQGDVTVIPGTLTWNADTGTALYAPNNTVVTLTASPFAGSVFNGWTGFCSGNATSCQFTMSADRSVTASFNSLADFSATPVSGSVPLTVLFTDESQNNPTSWLWDFGDGSTSTLQDPDYTYTSPGTYTVSLTATGTGGASTTTRANYISVGSCGNLLPVMIFDADPFFYPSLQAAYNDTLMNDVILAQALNFTGNFNLGDGVYVTIHGGYTCDFSSNPGFTTITGTTTIISGTVIMDRIRLK